MAEGTQPKSTAESAATAPEERKQKEEETLEKEDEEPEERKEPKVTESVSFEEESNIVADLQDPQKKALDELKLLIKAALANKEFNLPTPKEERGEEEKTQEPKGEEKMEVPSDSTPAKDEKKTRDARTKEKEGELKTKETNTEGLQTEESSASTPAKDEEEKMHETKFKEKIEETKFKEKTEEKEMEESYASTLVKEQEKEKAQEAKTEEKTKESKIEEKTDLAKTEELKTEGSTALTPAREDEEKTPEARTDEKPKESKVEEKPEEPLEQIFIWGVPLLGDDKSDTVLLKFLRARDFKVKEAISMIKNAIIWRKQFGIDALIDQDLDIPELEKAVFNHGFDKEGHPVCYNVFGKLQNKDSYFKVFGDGEKREKFLKWRIQHLEKGIREKLDFSPGGVCSMVQVIDLKNTIGPGKKDMRVATNKALTLLQDNYPEFVAKQVCINVPWWYLAYNMVLSSIFTQRSKSKFVFAGPSKSTETLFKYIAPGQVPLQYGGLSKENDSDFTASDVVNEVTIKPSSKHTIEIPAAERSVLVWELRVLGWEVTYGAEFSPNAKDGYTVIVQKARKFVPTDEPYVKNSFKIDGPGKVILTIDNATSKKKKLLYRSKEECATESN